MSSREIAELVEARHDNVKRTIERLADREVITLPPLEETSFRDTAGKAQRTSEYKLPKRDSFVVVAQLSPEFTARLVDRWQELEDQRVAPQPVDLSDPHVLQKLLIEQTSKRIELMARVEELEKRETHGTVDSWRARRWA